MMSEVVVCPCESSKSHFQAFPREGSLSHFFCKGSWAPKSKKSHFFARAPFAKKADSRAPLRREPRKNASFHAHTRIFIKKMTPRNPTPTESKDQAMGQRARTLLGPTARRAWRYSNALHDVQVGNRWENTFALQARLPLAPCETYAQNAKEGAGRPTPVRLRCFGYCPARVRTRQ